VGNTTGTTNGIERKHELEKGSIRVRFAIVNYEDELDSQATRDEFATHAGDVNRRRSCWVPLCWKPACW
jgi:hypothetical protein